LQHLNIEHLKHNLTNYSLPALYVYTMEKQEFLPASEALRVYFYFVVVVLLLVVLVVVRIAISQIKAF
jgi:hypothetical protein